MDVEVPFPGCFSTCSGCTRCDQHKVAAPQCPRNLTWKRKGTTSTSVLCGRPTAPVHPDKTPSLNWFRCYFAFCDPTFWHQCFRQIGGASGLPRGFVPTLTILIRSNAAGISLSPSPPPLSVRRQTWACLRGASRLWLRVW